MAEKIQSRVVYDLQGAMFCLQYLCHVLERVFLVDGVYGMRHCLLFGCVLLLSGLFPAYFPVRLQVWHESMADCYLADSATVCAGMPREKEEQE